MDIGNEHLDDTIFLNEAIELREMSSSQESDCTEHNEKLTLQELKTQIKSIETWFTDNVQKK